MQQTVKTNRERTLQIVVMAMMVALIFIFSRFLGITTDVIHLGLDFLPVMIVAYLYGPVWAALTYMIGDLVCAIGMPLGMINPGLTVIAGIIGLVYGFAFYKSDLSGWKLILVTVLASLAVAGIIKLFGTTLCLSVMYGSPYWPTLIARIPNCIVLFVAQVITLPIIYKCVAQPAGKLLKTNV